MIKRHSPHDPFQNQTKIEELEGLRGLAALLVVFAHLPKWNPLLDVGLINNGYLMVELFFVLSGFVIFTAYAEKIRDMKDVLRFQFLRLGRLYPVHIVFLFAFVAIELFKYIASTSFGFTSPNSVPFETNNLSAFIKSALLISSVFPTHELTFNYPAWSICVEFYTYLLFALSVLFLNKHRDVVFLTLATIPLGMLVTDITFGFDLLLKCVAGFFIGCLTAKVTNKLKVTVPGYTPSLVFVAILIFLQCKPGKAFDVMTYFLAAALIASLVLSENGLLKKVLNLRSLTWLGAISYSVYMSHAAIEWGANQIIRVALKKPEILSLKGKSTPQLTQLETAIACVAIAFAVLVVSALVHRFIEQPMRERSRQFASNKLRPSLSES